MQKPKLFLAACSLVLGALFICLAPTYHIAITEKAVLRVTTTTSIIGDAVKQLAGNRVALEVIMGPAIDPHSYHARLADISKLTDADIVLYHGLHLEGKMVSMLASINRYQPTYAVTKCLIPEELIASDEFGGMYDPHVWFDIHLWRTVVQHIAQILITHDPSGEQHYTERLHNYLTELDTLHHTIKQQIASIPEKHRYLVTSHDAFSYFGRAYGMHVIGIQGINLDSEPGIKDMQEIVRTISSLRIPTIFLETSLPHRSIEAIAQAVIAQGWLVRIGEELYSDALGQPKEAAGTYIGMIQENVTRIVHGLT